MSMFVLYVKRSLQCMEIPRENIVVMSVISKIDLGVHQMYELPLGEKYTLSIKEAAVYFNIGIKKMRRLAEENMGNFALVSGNRYLIIRTKFEEYLQNNSTI